MFDAYPTYSRYRALRFLAPPMVGEDIYGLQLALDAIRDFEVPIFPDGIFGRKTEAGLIAVQKDLALEPDGVAGPVSQSAIARRLCKQVRAEFGLPVGLPHGQVAHESSFILGNYSVQYPDGSYDAGLCQRNTNFTVPKLGFNPVDSLDALCLRTLGAFESYKGVADERRRWELATGNWNAPAFANYIAKEEGAPIPASNTARPSFDARVKLEAYMQSCTALLQL